MTVTRLLVVCYALSAAPAAAQSEPEHAATAHALVDRLLAAESPEERQRLARSAGDIPYPILRGAVTSLAAPAASPTDPGTPHRLRVQVPMPGAPPADYIVRLPPGYDPQRPHPALLALHHTGGAMQFMHDYWAADTDRAGVILISPQATVKRFEGWGSTEIERATIRAVLRDARARFACDPDRIGVTGMSMGGHATWEMGVFHPDQFSALFPVCGGPRKEVVPFVANLVAGPLLWQCQGALDQPELVRAVRLGVERLERAGGTVILEEEPDRGHVYFPERRAARLERLIAVARPAAPDRFTFLTTGPPIGRCHWLRVDAVSDDAYQIGDQVKLVFRKDPTEREKFLKLWKEIDEKLARVEARIDGNKILLKTTRITRLTLLLDAERFDPEKLIVVKVNGKKVWRGDVVGDPVALLTELGERADRGRPVDMAIPIEIGAKR